MKNLVFVLICFVIFPLFSYDGDWQQFFDLPVVDMESSEIEGIHFEGFVFAIAGDDGGLAYYTSPDSLHIFGTNLPPFISVAPDDPNDRIFCATGGIASNSEGLYLFDTTTEEFDVVFYIPGGNFVKKLPSGFYFGWGDEFLDEGGLFHSPDGEQWNVIEYFDNKNVFDIVETGEGIIFVAASDGLHIIDNGSINSFSGWNTAGSLYVRQSPYDDEVYLAFGIGSYSDGIYQVEYEDGEITDLTIINWVFMAHTIYEYPGYFVVGSKSTSTSNLFLVEPVQFGDVHQIGSELGIDEVHCFDHLSSIYCPNILVGSDAGLFLGTALLTDADDIVVDNKVITLFHNYPNPFNPETNISFSLQKTDYVNLEIFNLRGQKIKTLLDEEMLPGKHSVVWDGRDEWCREVASGIYLYKLSTKQEVVARKMILMK